MLGWLAAGLAVWWVFFRKSSVVTAAGNLRGIILDNASMGIHQLVKAPDGFIDVTVSWSGATKSALGVGISWPYRVVVSLQTGVAPKFFFTFSPTIPGGFLVAQTTTVRMGIPIDAPPGTIYNVWGVLQAAVSDPNGNPTVDFLDIPGVELVHSSAIKIAAGVTPQGGIGSVDVAQIVQNMRL